MRSALTAIEWPDDELSVFATLKGPLFGVRDDALLAWRERFHRIHPLGPVDLDADAGEELAEVASVLEVLNEDFVRTAEAKGLTENVVRSAGENDLVWPIAQDNDFVTWRAYSNRFWPAKYLVDKDGFDIPTSAKVLISKLKSR